MGANDSELFNKQVHDCVETYEPRFAEALGGVAGAAVAAIGGSVGIGVAVVPAIVAGGTTVTAVGTGMLVATGVSAAAGAVGGAVYGATHSSEPVGNAVADGVMGGIVGAAVPSVGMAVGAAGAVMGSAMLAGRKIGGAIGNWVNPPEKACEAQVSKYLADSGGPRYASDTVLRDHFSNLTDADGFTLMKNELTSQRPGEPETPVVTVITSRVTTLIDGKNVPTGDMKNTISIPGMEPIVTGVNSPLSEEIFHATGDIDDRGRGDYIRPQELVRHINDMKAKAAGNDITAAGTDITPLATPQSGQQTARERG